MAKNKDQTLTNTAKLSPEMSSKLLKNRQ